MPTSNETLTPLNEEGVRPKIVRTSGALAAMLRTMADWPPMEPEHSATAIAAADALEAQQRAYLALAERVEVMREALAPFADYVAVDPADPDVSLADLEGHSLLTKDFRAARAALTPTPE